MAKQKFERTKPHMNIGTIGHVDHGKTTALPHIAYFSELTSPFILLAFPYALGNDTLGDRPCNTNIRNKPHHVWYAANLKKQGKTMEELRDWTEEH